MIEKLKCRLCGKEHLTKDAADLCCRVRSRVKEGLMLTDDQLLRKLGISLDRGRQILDALDRDRSAGFPRKQPMWEYRRYWPAVDKWLEHNSHLLQTDRLSA